MSYEDVVHFAGNWGLVYFLILFVGVLVYALWPGNRKKFERAARLPLEEE
ncbi:MAG TPA: cbb3-type cytochrome c oxidase subunit 3 [Kiloniellales bacterium]|nr:cbb3-type cytochrome c oxidase subunit 3 [Kiloniellales bacterium]